MLPLAGFSPEAIEQQFCQDRKPPHFPLSEPQEEAKKELAEGGLRSYTKGFAGWTCAGPSGRDEDPMKQGIHPKYNKIVVTCACGNRFETGSTKSEIRLELCSACHPFYTGKQKLIDTAGRIERFQKRYGLQ